VASDLCAVALGSDTGGSIRQPSSFCGVVGLKPTYGSVSRYGLTAFASSLDQIGPITKNIEDAQILFDVIKGKDKKDSTSIDFDYKNEKADVKKLKIGVPKEYFSEGLSKEVGERIKEKLFSLKEKGAKLVEISLPHTEYAIPTYYIIATSEASANLSRFDGIKYGLSEKGNNLLEVYLKTKANGFGTEVKRRIMLGTYALSSGYYDAFYLKAQKVRTLIKKDFEEAFKKVDVIVSPVAPTTAFKIGERVSDPLTMYLSDIFTIAPNMAGLPGISVPCGFDGKKLPVGLQLLAKPFCEPEIFNAAFCYQQETGWNEEKPEL